MLQDFLIQSENQLPAAFLLFVRMSGLLVTAPVFGHRSIPVLAKAALSLVLTLLLSAALPLQPLADDLDVPAYLVQILMESSVGLILGFTAQLFFSVTQIAGQIIDVAMGLGIGSVLDDRVDGSVLGQIPADRNPGLPFIAAFQQIRLEIIPEDVVKSRKNDVLVKT